MITASDYWLVIIYDNEFPGCDQTKITYDLATQRITQSSSSYTVDWKGVFARDDYQPQTPPSL